MSTRRTINGGVYVTKVQTQPTRSLAKSEYSVMFYHYLRFYICRHMNAMWTYIGRFTNTVAVVHVSACTCMWICVRVYTRYLAGIHSKQNNRVHPLRIYIDICTYAHACICMHTFCKLTGPATILFLSVLINISRCWLR